MLVDYTSIHVTSASFLSRKVNQKKNSVFEAYLALLTCLTCAFHKRTVNAEDLMCRLLVHTFSPAGLLLSL